MNDSLNTKRQNWRNSLIGALVVSSLAVTVACIAWVLMGSI